MIRVSHCDAMLSHDIKTICSRCSHVNLSHYFSPYILLLISVLLLHVSLFLFIVNLANCQCTPYMPCCPVQLIYYPCRAVLEVMLRSVIYSIQTVQSSVFQESQQHLFALADSIFETETKYNCMGSGCCEL